MSLYKSTSFLSEIKTFFKNSDMTAAMQNLSSILSGMKMAEKVGENSKTLYQTRDGNHSAPTLVKLGEKQKKQKYSRKLRGFYMVYDAKYGNVPVRIFLIRRTKHGKWNGLLTTDTEMDFFKA